MAENQDYYYSGEQKIFLERVEDVCTVGFKEEIPEKRAEAVKEIPEALAILGQSGSLKRRNVTLHQTKPGQDMNKLIQKVEKREGIAFAASVYRVPGSDMHLILLDEFVARFKSSVTEEEIRAFNAQNGVEVIEKKPYIANKYLLRVPKDSTKKTLEMTNFYHKSELVKWAAPNFLSEKKKAFIPHDTFYTQQWHLENTGQGGGIVGEDVHAEQAWDITQGSPDVVIAIFDEGVDIDHPDLNANIHPEGRDFEGRGDRDPRPKPDGCSNPASHPPGCRCNPHAHGTACAGVAAAIGDNNTGVTGIAFRCRILPIKMLLAAEDEIADAFLYAANDVGAQVLSNSWGYDAAVAHPDIDDAITEVTTNSRDGNGAIVVFASANANVLIPRGNPSTHLNVITVGASNNVAQRSGYSNWGDNVDTPDLNSLNRKKRLNVLAPSDGTSANPIQWSGYPPDGSTRCIYTTDITGNRGYNPPQPGRTPEPVDVTADYTALFGGTSAACPLVAGIAALMLCVNPDLTYQQVRYILEATADKIDDGNAHYVPTTGHSEKYGFGRVNAHEAIKAARSSIPQEDYCQQIEITLRRNIDLGPDMFVSDEIQAVDARRRNVTISETEVIRAGTDGFLHAEYPQPAGATPITDEVEVEE